MKKIICLVIITILFITGCGKKEMDTAINTGTDISEEAEKGSSPAVGEDRAGSEIFSTVKSSSSSRDESASMEATPASFGEAMSEGKSVEAEGIVDGNIIIPTQIVPGVLTAGEWNDNDNWGFLSNLVLGGYLNFPSFQLSPLKRVVVNVYNSKGPVKNAEVALYNEAGDILWEAITDYKGVAYVFYQVTDNTSVPILVIAGKNGVTAAAAIEIQNSDQSGQGAKAVAETTEISLELEDTQTGKAIDIMFMFDTTGSMGDELLYLQKEFEDIANRVADQSTRFSVNFYRDIGDNYVVKSNDFTTNIDELKRLLNAESADGGGDYPEAVDQALYNGVFEHSWNKDSVKLLFLILDAPPHSNDAAIYERLRVSITEAARQGIRIIPIASSGVDKETETFLRTAAMLTGGTYTFLTNHSGIGNPHLEPTIGSYTVEFLNDCIVRLIQLYYS